MWIGRSEQRQQKHLLSGFVEQAYIEMFSLNGEITRNASASSYDIK